MQVDDLIACYLKHKSAFGAFNSECQKPCKATEYHGEAKKAGIDNRRDCFQHHCSVVTSIEYEIDLPTSTIATRTGQPFKTVYQEYFIWNANALVGTVGGTLGLFIGFSFHGSLMFVWEHVLEVGKYSIFS